MVEPLGIVFALAAALAVAVTSVTVRLGTTEGPSTDVLVVVIAVNFVVFVSLAAVLYYPDYGLTPRSIVAFVLAGIVGTMLARALYYESIRRIGASRSEPIKASNPLYAAVIAVLVLGETLTGGHLAGILLIVLGVALVSAEGATSPATGEDGVPWRGLLLPFTAAFFYGLDPVFSKLGLVEGTPLLVGLAVKTVAGGAAFFGYLWWRDTLPRTGLLGPGWSWKLAAGLGNTLFLLAYFAAIAVAPVAVVFPIMQTSPLVVAVISFLFLQRLERVTLRLVAGALIVVVGAIAVTLLG